MFRLTGEWVNDDRIFRFWLNYLFKATQSTPAIQSGVGTEASVWLVAGFQNIWLLYRDLQLAKYLFTLGSTVCLSTYPLL